MNNYSCIDKTTKEVINNIVWDGISPIESSYLQDCIMIKWDENTKGYPVSVGFIYDTENLGFISPKPEQNPSFIFNKEIWRWTYPIPYPDDNQDYDWDEENVQWVPIEENDTIDLETELQKLIEQ